MPSDAPQSTASPAQIRLDDNHTRAVVEQERQQRGDSTAAKTARSMILERAAQLATERSEATPAKPTTTPPRLTGPKPVRLKAAQ